MPLVFSIKNLLNRLSRTILSAVGVALGVAMIIGLVSVSDGLKQTTDDFSKLLGNTIYVVADNVFGDVSKSELDISILERIEKIPEVELATPLAWNAVELEGYTPPITFAGNIIDFVGIDPELETRTASEYTKIKLGRPLYKGEEKSAMVGVAVLQNLGKKVGDEIKIIYKGVDYRFTIVGAFETGNSNSDLVIVVDISKLRKITGLAQDRINAARVLPKKPELSETVERKIKLLIPNVNPSFARAAVRSLTSFTTTLQIVTWLIAGISALVGGLGIANTMAMSVAERIGEIGILKAVGWSDRDVLVSVMEESIFISVLGGIFGVAIGAVAVIFVLPKFISGIFVPVLTIPTVSFAFLFAIALGAIGGFFPARTAASLEPVLAFRGGE